ncbi:hypothetical protein [Promicromonospora sp. NPDC023987]|uniref:hypothetical protein n=1 Tax=Promicromonospora sp. NPDC023987 TaxID=3155360 RepID=UPI0033BFD5EC
MVSSRKQKRAIKDLTAQVDALRVERHARDDVEVVHSLGFALFELSSELRHKPRMTQDYRETLNEGIEVLGESRLDPRVTNALGAMLARRAWLQLQIGDDRRARESAEACAALLQDVRVTDALDPVEAVESLVTSAKVLARCGRHDASLEAARLAEGFAAEADQPADFERLSCLALLAHCSALEAVQDHDAARVKAQQAARYANRAFETDANGQNAYVTALTQHAVATAMSNEQRPRDALPFAQSAVDWFEQSEKLGHKSYSSMNHTAALTTLMHLHLALGNQREARSYANSAYNSLGYRVLRTSDIAELRDQAQAVVSALLEVGKTRDAQFVARVVNKRTGASS